MHSLAALRYVSVAVHLTIKIPGRNWTYYLSHKDKDKDSVPALSECHCLAKEANEERNPC